MEIHTQGGVLFLSLYLAILYHF